MSFTPSTSKFNLSLSFGIPLNLLLSVTAITMKTTYSLLIKLVLFVCTGNRHTASMTLIIVSPFKFMLNGDTIIEYETFALPLGARFRDFF